MNKTTILIAGGASAASLAAGGAAGYLYAKRKFEATVDGLIETEVAKTKKYFSVLLAEARSGKPDDPADLNRSTTKDVQEPDDEEPEELTEADLKAIEKGRETLARAGKALTDYQGFAKTSNDTDVVENNIFSSSATPKKQLPPRGPGGKFQSKKSVQEPEPSTEGDPPQRISEQEFLLNDGEFEQKNLLYFINDKTLIDVENNNEPVDEGLVGEVNLTLFPPADEDGGSSIYVRNAGLEIDFEVRLMTESLTEFIGLGDSEGEDVDENEYV